MNRQAAILILVFAFLVSLFGCSKSIKPKETVLGGFECNFVLNLDETRYKGNAEIKDDNTAEFSFTSPESINGLTLRLENEEYTASFGDIIYKGNFSDLPNANPLVCVYSALFFNHSEEDLKSDSDGYFAEEEVSGNGYKIYYRADGFPQKIIFADTETKIEFSNISYLF